MPPIVAVLLLAVVVTRLDFGAFWAAIREINAFAYASFIVGFNFCLLLADAFGTRHVYASSVAPVRYRDLLVLRVASYLPSMLNHHLGQAWLTYFISRMYRVSAWSVAGATLLVYVTVFGDLYLVACCSLLFQKSSAPWLAPTLLGLTAVAIVYAGVILWPPSWLRRWPTMTPLIQAGFKGHLVSLLFRLPHTAILLCGMWMAFGFFGIRIPFADSLVVIPPLMMVSALPITPQGMGTRELVALELITPFAVGAPEERAARVVAASVVFVVSLTILQIGISPLFMREAYRRLARAGSEP